MTQEEELDSLNGDERRVLNRCIEIADSNIQQAERLLLMNSYDESWQQAMSKTPAAGNIRYNEALRLFRDIPLAMRKGFDRGSNG